MLISSMKARRLTTLPNPKPISIADVAWNLPLGAGHTRYHEIGLLILIETS
jgi:hypothetical protein